MEENNPWCEMTTTIMYIIIVQPTWTYLNLWRRRNSAWFEALRSVG